MPRRAVFLALALVFVGLGAVSGQSHAGAEQQDTSIIVQAYKVSSGQVTTLYSVRPDGSQLRVLAPKGGSPTLSPDRTLIAFERPRDIGEDFRGDRIYTDDLYVMDVNGTRKRLLSRTGSHDPTWSPDGNRIAYVKAYGGASAIWVVNRDGSGNRRLARNGEWPSWSTDGKQIAFLRYDGQTDATGVFIVSPDGVPRERVLIDGRRVDAVTPISWSPNGRMLALVAYDDGGRLHVASADGRNLKRLGPSSTGEGDAIPEWSPDNSSLLYMRELGGEDAIYLTRVASRGAKLVSRNSSNPAWSPDGRRVAGMYGFKQVIVATPGTGDRRSFGVKGVRAVTAIDW